MKALDILRDAHFSVFNEFCKTNRRPGEIRKFDALLAALGTLEQAAKYLEEPLFEADECQLMIECWDEHCADDLAEQELEEREDYCGDMPIL